MNTPGHAIFTERLARFAADVDVAAVHRTAARAEADVVVAVHGRPGVGRGRVARALAAAQIAVGENGDVDVHVVAEVVKPEDRAAIAASDRPSLLVWTDADLVADPRGWCARFRALTGVATVPMARGGVHPVLVALAPLLAEARYRRVRSACTGLEVLAATGDDRVAAFLRDDDTVVACMAAAVDVVQSVGIAVDPSDDPGAHLRRAAYWQRYRGGPVSPLHSACAADIVRGSMRLWRRASS